MAPPGLSIWRSPRLLIVDNLGEVWDALIPGDFRCFALPGYAARIGSNHSPNEYHCQSVRLDRDLYVSDTIAQKLAKRWVPCFGIAAFARVGLNALSEYVMRHANTSKRGWYPRHVYVLTRTSDFMTFDDREIRDRVTDGWVSELRFRSTSQVNLLDYIFNSNYISVTLICADDFWKALPSMGCSMIGQCVRPLHPTSKSPLPPTGHEERRSSRKAVVVLPPGSQSHEKSVNESILSKLAALEKRVVDLEKDKADLQSQCQQLKAKLSISRPPRKLQLCVKETIGQSEEEDKDCDYDAVDDLTDDTLSSGSRWNGLSSVIMEGFETVRSSMDLQMAKLERGLKFQFLQLQTVVQSQIALLMATVQALEPSRHQTAPGGDPPTPL